MINTEMKMLLYKRLLICVLFNPDSYAQRKEEVSFVILSFQAYLSLIANSRHCIYIENQFFVSIIDSPEVSNEICKVLCERIKRAYRLVMFYHLR